MQTTTPGALLGILRCGSETGTNDRFGSDSVLGAISAQCPVCSKADTADAIYEYTAKVEIAGERLRLCRPAGRRLVHVKRVLHFTEHCGALPSPELPGSQLF